MSLVGNPDRRTWRERHPFLYGMSQTFGIAQVRQPVESPADAVRHSFERVAAAIAEAEKRSVGNQQPTQEGEE